MNQLSLNIIPRLPYAPKNFILHSGLAEIWPVIENVIAQNEFVSTWITAGRRFGKTHLSVKMVDRILAEKKYPMLLDSKGFAELLEEGSYREESSGADVYIIDDSDHYFNRTLPGSSGPFVSFFEFIRSRRGKVIFLSSVPIDSLPSDEHIKSRLLSGMIHSVGAPGDQDMLQLLVEMSRQRGLAIKEKRLQFISKRLRRDIPYIESYLDRVSSLSGILNRSVTRPLLSNAL